MDDFRVVQLSDTHLSERHPAFIPNFRAAGRMIAALGPDLVVNTGDITFDKPLFRERADEVDVGHRYVPPDHRRRLLDLLGARLGLVASGHVHQHRRRRVDGVEHCWGPSTAFVFPDARQPRLGTKRVGYVEYAFGPDRVDVRIVEPPELANQELSVAADADSH